MKPWAMIFVCAIALAASLLQSCCYHYSVSYQGGERLQMSRNQASNLVGRDIGYVKEKLGAADEVEQLPDKKTKYSWIFREYESYRQYSIGFCSGHHENKPLLFEDRFARPETPLVQEQRIVLITGPDGIVLKADVE